MRTVQRSVFFQFYQDNTLKINSIKFSSNVGKQDSATDYPERMGIIYLVFPEKEQALYFFNDLENLSNERGATYFLSLSLNLIQVSYMMDSLDKNRKTNVTHPEVIIEK